MCKHKWVDMEDGSLDKFCVRCSKKAMQAVIKPMSQVDKEDWMKELNKQIGIGIGIDMRMGR